LANHYRKRQEGEPEVRSQEVIEEYLRAMG
jgi:hypothetical protein